MNFLFLNKIIINTPELYIHTHQIMARRNFNSNFIGNAKFCPIKAAERLRDATYQDDIKTLNNTMQYCSLGRSNKSK